MISPHLWESKVLWNRVWMLALKVEVGRKDRLLRLLATISVGIEKNNQFHWDQAVSCFGWQPHCVFATPNHYQTKRKQQREFFLNLKLLILIVQLVNYFPYWSESGQQWQQSHFYIIDIGTYHNNDTRVSKCYKKGLCFGLTKALLAEGDAFFPPLPYIAALLLRKVMRAQRQRELQEKITSWTKNTNLVILCQLHSCGVFFFWNMTITFIAGWVSLIMEFSHNIRLCCNACACKGLAISALCFPAKK